MTRKWNLAVVRRDEEHWEEASTFPSSESWQGKVCGFHPAHVSPSEKSQNLFNFSSRYFVTLNLPDDAAHAAACTCVRGPVPLLRASPDVHPAHHMHVTPEYSRDGPKSYQTQTKHMNATLHFTNTDTILAIPKRLLKIHTLYLQ